ncbi:low molecular weight protein-tyrosine-phosphatase [Lentisalinibacter orientalis]|uniref:low molecular weight protein-tyrosine-phosphatase n=1 Tax=Lentisalinibacter orientalis TaxID=2992241 RepID=UPI00386617D1
MEKPSTINVLFVCMGNICRSPTAAGVFRKLVADAGLEEFVHIDSAGTHAYHTGEPPDQRAAAAAERRGFDLSGQSARRVTAEDFERFDYVLAMDRDNHEILLGAALEDHHGRIRLFLEFGSDPARQEVPDPYYGGAVGFERVLDLVEDAAQGLLRDVRARLGRA